MSVYRRDPFSHHLAPPLWRTRADSVPPFSEQCLNNLCRLNFLPIRFYEIGYAIIVYGIVWIEPRRKKNCDFILVDGRGIYALTRNLTTIDFLVKHLVNSIVCSDFDGVSFDTSYDAFLADLPYCA